MVVIKIIGNVLDIYDPFTHFAEQYLQSVEFDTDALGRCRLVATPNLQQAQKFADAAEALSLWKTQSKVLPIRPDGKPNRALTAWTIEVVPVKQVYMKDHPDEEVV